MDDGLLANLGVIAGIIFLAVELRQNRESPEAQIRTIRHTIRAADYQLPLEHRDFAEALLKRRRGEPLAEYEQFILGRAMAMTLLNYQYVCSEYRRGRIRERSARQCGAGHAAIPARAEGSGNRDG